MKAIRNLCILFIFLLSFGSGVFFLFNNDPQNIRESRKADLAIIDKFEIAIRSVILQFKMPHTIFASAARIHNYRTEPPAKDWHVEYGYTWGSNCESTHEGNASLREYDWHGNYKEMTAKQSSDGTYEETYNVGYERKKDQDLN